MYILPREVLYLDDELMNSILWLHLINANLITLLKNLTNQSNVTNSGT